ncbi:hypothetical protein ACFQXA_22145 [Nocardiopsis composta]
MLRLLWAGLLATALTTLYAVVDPLTTRLLAAQVEAGYPSYTPEEVGTAAGAYVAILAAIGVLGIAGWVVTILLARAGKRAAVWLGVVLCAVGVLVALTGLATPDTSGTIGLAPVFGWLLLAPCAIGAFALAAMWRRA